MTLDRRTPSPPEWPPGRGERGSTREALRDRPVDAPRGCAQRDHVTIKECTFCRIARGDLAAHVVFADDDFVAFLDHRPLFAGHALVIPRAHVDTFLDLASERVGPLFQLVQRVSRAVERGMEADGVFNAVNNRISQSVPHLHVHVIPRRKKDGLKGFFWPRYAYSGEEEMARVRAAIAAAMEAS